MNKKIYILCIFTGIIFTSCKYTTGINSRAVKHKTSMGNFEHLNSPIVCSFTFQTGYSNFYPKYGTIYYVYDWETDKIYDWVFDKNWVLNWREVKVGKKYLTASNNGYAYLDSETGTVTYRNLDFFSDLFHRETPGKLGMLSYDKLTEEEYYNSKVHVNVFDSETGLIERVPNLDFCYASGSHYAPLKADNDGNLWVCASYRPEKDTTYYRLIKLDLENKETTEHNKCNSYKALKRDGTLSPYNENIIAISDDYVITNYYLLGAHDKNDPMENNINFYSISDINAGVQKQIQFPISVYGNSFIGNALVINNNLYVLLRDGEYNKRYVDVYKASLDNSLEDLELEYEVRMNIDYTEDVYARGNRIYLLNSRVESHFIYMWYDTVTGELSEWKGYDMEKMIELWANGELED